jgi:hypothetical protein
MYHSVATLIPSGEVLITGSNPNEDVSSQTYHTEYRVELLQPPYMRQSRPTFRWCPDHIIFGRSFKLILTLPKGVNYQTMDMSIVVADLGYHTHGVAVDQRLVELVWRDYDHKTGQVLVKSPKDGSYFPPGAFERSRCLFKLMFCRPRLDFRRHQRSPFSGSRDGHGRRQRASFRRQSQRQHAQGYCSLARRSRLLNKAREVLARLFVFQLAFFSASSFHPIHPFRSSVNYILVFGHSTQLN